MPAVTLALALVGAATGIAALMIEVWSLVIAGPRVKIVVANALVSADGNWWLSIDVSNIGRLPVTLLDVGVAFQIRGEWKRAPIATMPPQLISNRDIPRRLVDGDQATWLVHPGALAADLHTTYGARDVYVYARLATGKTDRSRNRIDLANLANL